jgi:hypothetical protein
MTSVCGLTFANIERSVRPLNADLRYTHCLELKLTGRSAMGTASPRVSGPDERSIVTGLTLGILGLAWHAIRAPILLFLVILEPFVRLVLGGAAVLGVLSAIVFEASAVPNSHFWFIISMSFGCLLVLALYHALIRLLS